MSLTEISEQGRYFNYAILSTKVSKTLRILKNGKKLSQREKNVLKRGADLILKIKVGAALSEGTTQESLMPTEENIFVYGYALSALDKLSPKIENGYTSFFKNLYSEIKKNISTNEKVSSDDIMDLLISFFSQLGYFFRREIQKNRYGNPDYSLVSLERKGVDEYPPKTFN